jgi:hypothetical protein
VPRLAAAGPGRDPRAPSTPPKTGLTNQGRRPGRRQPEHASRQEGAAEPPRAVTTVWSTWKEAASAARAGRCPPRSFTWRKSWKCCHRCEAPSSTMKLARH